MLTNLPHRISFMQSSRTAFEGGAYTNTLSSVSIEWANVQRVNMINNVQNYKDQQFNYYKITVRNGLISETITIDNTLSIYWDDKVLSINSVSDGSNRGHMLRLDCEEEIGNG